MISMTGFACREWADENISVSVEVKGYNSRFLEINVNSPSWLSHLEPQIRDIIAGVCGRGKVEVSVRIREINSHLNVSVNTNVAQVYLKAISDLANNLDLDEKLSVSELIRLEGVLEVEKIRNNEKYWYALEPVLRETAGAFQAEKVREGNFTEEVILNFISQIEASLQKVESRAADLENSIRENLVKRFRELVGSEIDQNRILAETAVLLMKYTISEEISRLSSHLGEFRAETAKNDRAGKKLDFLSQEIGREINTIGSKSTIIEINRAVVDMKEALENIREQLRNVE